MLAKVVFFIAVAAAVLVVILLATVSPLPSKPWRDRNQLSALSLSLYVSRTPQFSFSHPILTDPGLQQQGGSLQANSTAFVFCRDLTAGPESISRVVGRVRGFLVFTDGSALAAFNVLHLELDISPECRGSLSLEADGGAGDGLRVVGGTKSFAFARGTAVVVPVGGWPAHSDAVYQFKLSLRLPKVHLPIPAG